MKHKIADAKILGYFERCFRNSVARLVYFEWNQFLFRPNDFDLLRKLISRTYWIFHFQMEFNKLKQWVVFIIKSLPGTPFAYNYPSFYSPFIILSLFKWYSNSAHFRECSVYFYFQFKFWNFWPHFDNF